MGLSARSVIGLPTRCIRHGQDVLLDLRREAEEAEDLGHPGTGDALPSRDLGLRQDLRRTR